MSKTFTAQVFRWLYQVNDDHELPASAAKIAIYLAPNFNEDEGGAAWPSCKTIDDAIGKSESTVKQACLRPARSQRLGMCPLLKKSASDRNSNILPQDRMAPSWQGKSSRRVAGRCSYVFGLLVRHTKR
jgi:hypothetical protein